MDNRVFFQHHELATAGLVDGVLCIDDDHGNMHPFVDFDTQQPYYECLFCDYRIKPGMLMQEALRAQVAKAQHDMWDGWDDGPETD